MRNATLLIVSLFLLTTCVDDTANIPESCEGLEWSYTGSTGPSKWTEICTGFSTCGGQAQSPINITTSSPGSVLTALKTNYNDSKTFMRNDRQSIEFNYDSGSTIEWKGDTYTLKQFHFHNSSEHQVQSNAFPMEAHLVHENASGKWVVIGVFVTAGAENKVLKAVEANYPVGTGAFYSSSDRITVQDILPANKGYYTYAGSRTTPPCTEGLEWIVLKEPITASLAQIQKLSSITKQNNRPIQPLNGRQVLRFD